MLAMLSWQHMQCTCCFYIHFKPINTIKFFEVVYSGFGIGVSSCFQEKVKLVDNSDGTGEQAHLPCSNDV